MVTKQTNLYNLLEYPDKTMIDSKGIQENIKFSQDLIALLANAKPTLLYEKDYYQNIALSYAVSAADNQIALFL